MAKFKWQACGCCCTAMVVCYVGLSWYAARIFVSLNPRVRDISHNGFPWTPANVTHHWKRSISDLAECTTDELLDGFENFTSSQQSHRVYFNSRPGHSGQDTVRLAGWWLPARSARLTLNSTMRVVLQHGYRRNSLDHSVQLTGYLLRTIGISALLVDLRDHGASDASQNKHVTWSWAYPLDLLGAWDYAVSDPDGVLGGPLPPASVGILGFSMGGFIAAGAFGLEPLVPALWMDGPPFRVKDVLKQGIVRKLRGNEVLASLVAPLAMQCSKWITGVDLSMYSPISMLSNNTAEGRRSMAAVKLENNGSGDDSTPEAEPRPVAIVGNTVDTTVPVSQIHRMLDLFKESPGKFEVKEAWVEHMRCGAGSHCTMHNWRPQEYQSKLCWFWHNALQSGDPESCGLHARQRRFSDCPVKECPAWPWYFTPDLLGVTRNPDEASEEFRWYVK